MCPATPTALLLYCRPGFEKECAAEIQHHAAAAGPAGYVKAKAQSGYLLFQPLDPAPSWWRSLPPPAGLIFARQAVAVAELVKGLPVGDRVAPLLAVAEALAAAAGGPFRELRLETADTNEAKELLPFCRKLAPVLERAARHAGVVTAAGTATLHLFFLGSAAAYVGFSDPAVASPWPMGIPRLKFPREAPSRSTLKLEEALLTFLTPAEREERLRPGMTAVDLGAAPGGWSWQLVRRGLRVIAVDNGPMQPALLASGLVEQRCEDGFRFRPPQPVDWLVCDMVEQPGRIARLMGEWLAGGWAREAIFNLKLPMKRRWEESGRCAAIIAERLEGVAYSLRLKQLYHDREEITGHLRLEGPGGRKR